MLSDMCVQGKERDRGHSKASGVLATILGRERFPLCLQIQFSVELALEIVPPMRRSE